MKLKYITIGNINKSNFFLENLSSYIGYEVKKENYEEMDVLGNTYYLLDNSEIKLLNESNMHKIILYFLRPTGPIFALEKGYIPAAGIQMTNDGDWPKFFGIEKILNLTENSLIKNIGSGYCFFESKKSTKHYFLC